MNARVIVADDEADIRQLVAFTLRRRGHTVIEAATGDAALALITTERPDLAVLDVMMPGLSGLDIARVASADPATAAIPIILLSAKGQVSEINEGLASGARKYLVKPFSPRHLAETVADLLETCAITETLTAHA